MSILYPRLKESDQEFPDYTLKNLLPGSYVLLHNRHHSFWCCVIDILERGYLDAFIASHGLEGSLQFGNVIRCHRRHIFDIGLLTE